MATPIPTNAASFSHHELSLLFPEFVTFLPDEKQAAFKTRSVTTDSRTLAEGSLFVALVGEHTDGHHYLEKALQGGALAFLIHKNKCSKEQVELFLNRYPDAIFYLVSDTEEALLSLAKHYLLRWKKADKKVVMLTGSAGKTTTKELIFALLQTCGETQKTIGNLNNLIGLPMSIFTVEEKHQYLVLEAGMSIKGELEKLAKTVAPDISLLLNVGLAHAEGVGGKEGVAFEKGAIYEWMNPSGKAIVNADDSFARREAKRALKWVKEENLRPELIAFGTQSYSDFLGQENQVEVSSNAYIQVHLSAETPSLSESTSAPFLVHVHYTFYTPSLDAALPQIKELRIRSPFWSEAQKIDLGAAIASFYGATGILPTEETLEKALLGVRLEGRNTLLVAPNGVWILDDSYNANPESMRSAFESLTALARLKNHSPCLVLGEMKELGAYAEEEHKLLGNEILNISPRFVISCGGLMNLALELPQKQGIPCFYCANSSDAAKLAQSLVLCNDLVLVKASRSVQAEKVSLALKAMTFEQITKQSEAT